MATTTITDTEFQTVIPLVPIPSHLPTLQDGKDHPQLESKDVTGSDHEVYPTRLKGGKAIMVALQLMLVMVCNSFTMGLVTIGVTKIADDLHMNQSLVYWPAIVYNLTSSPLLLPFGSIADIVGARPVNLMGSLLCGIFVLSCGLARTGNQLIAFRGLQGVGAALYLPTSMSIISTALAIGKLRNIALASLGLGQVIGYGLGLVIGGVLIDTIGWRTGFYICGALQLALFLLGSFTIPRAANPASNTAETAVWQKLRKQMDWTGALISCVSIGMLSYVLAMLAEDSTAIKKPWNITLLALSLLLVPVFVFWMRRQERHNKPAMIPNSLWTTAFTSICVMIAFSYAEIQCMEMLTSLLYAALSFLNIQALSPIQSAVRLLPGIVTGTLGNIVVAQFVHKVSVSWTSTAFAILAGVAPLLMAIINPLLPYWYEAFPAQILYSIFVDVMFVVAALIISDTFPHRDQALAGAVFNTIANLGQALGLALIAVIANTVTVAREGGHTVTGDEHVQSLLDGYRAGFWTSFACMLATGIIGAWGLRKVGRVGIKRD